MMKSAHDVHQRVRQARTSFYWAMRLLPRPRREAMFALYAYCRELDDIADGPGRPEDKLIELDHWRKKLDALFAGQANGVVANALSEAVWRYGLERNELNEIISGMEMDARGDMLAPPLDVLWLYCRRVAGAVGLLSLPVFGAKGSDLQPFAIALGEALQLTNILRDLDEDARLGRLYLPAEFLDDAGITARDPLTVLADASLPDVCERIAALAAARFTDAHKAAGRSSGLGPALAMMAVYQRLLQRLRQRGWQTRQTRPRLGLLASMTIAVRHVAFGRL